jgi:Flp pilus assembly protein CpaB
MKRANLIMITAVITVILLIIEIIIVRNMSDYEPKINVVYAKTDIPAGTEITGDMVEERSVSISMAHRSSFRASGSVLGKTAESDIEAGEMLLSHRISEKIAAKDIEVKDKNSRLFSVELKGDQANGWQLKAGQYVDIMFVPDRSTEDPSKPSNAEDIIRLPEVRIAALIDDKGRLLGDSDVTSLPKYISFEVDKKQDEFLAYAKGSGRIELSAVP